MSKFDTTIEEIVFHNYTLSIMGQDEIFDLWTTTSTATEVLKRLKNKVAGKRITEIISKPEQSTYEERVESISTTFSGDYGGCKVCNQFDCFIWASVGASEVAILACTRHKLFIIAQSSRYKGNEIYREFLSMTWDDITESMDDQNNMIKVDGEMLPIVSDSSDTMSDFPCHLNWSMQHMR